MAWSSRRGDSLRLGRVVRLAATTAIAALAIGSSPSCKSSGIALSVDLRTDFVPVRDFATIVTEIVPEGTGPRQSEHVAGPTEKTYVSGTRIADFGDIPAGSVLVKVKVVGNDGAPLVERLARLSVQSDYSLTVVVTRNCEGVVCPDPGGDASLSTCDRGKCVSPECTTGSLEKCNAAECASDTDCHADAACVTAHCVTGTCLFVPDDAKCDATQSCDVNHGCTPPLGPACTPSGTKETLCGDGVDDDCDGKIDCLDPDCDTLACEDGDLCTIGETCVKGACGGATPKDCNDDDACTSDACDPKTGCTHAPLSTGTCDDGNACTESDRCVDGKCTAGTAKDCDDGNPCTDDICEPKAGCTKTNNTVTCDDGDACTTGDVCADGTCKPGTAKSCDDGNPCTDDACDKVTGCTKTNNTAPCQDGVFCNGSDTCAGGTCATHAGNPCGQICDEPGKQCLGCIVDGDCGPIAAGAWDACGGFADACDTTGTQSRTVTTPKCSTGTCTYPTTVETQACPRVTENAACGTVTYGTWSACGGYASFCDEGGTRTRSVTTPVCKSGACSNVVTTETGTCARNTDGLTGCQATSATAFGACGGFANACDTTGSQSRTVTTYACVAGACKGTAANDTRSCSRTVANGTGCGSGNYCCGGSCVSKSSGAHCGACGVSCGDTGGTCRGLGSGHWACSCSSNAACQNAGYGSGATCYNGICNCQCTANNCCSGADCFIISGNNYCSY